MKIKRQSTGDTLTTLEIHVPPRPAATKPAPKPIAPQPVELESEPEPPAAPPEKTAGTREPRPRDSAREAIRDIRAFFIKLAVVAVAGWVLLGLVFGLAVVQGEDMYPRLRDGDLMLFYRLQKDYYIGDVVTFTLNGRRYTGRIVAQGGDTVDINDNGELLVNGNIQSEEIFYPTQDETGQAELPCEVPADSVYLLCDFRTNGTDSRSYGPVALEQLDGKVIAILRRRGI